MSTSELFQAASDAASFLSRSNRAILDEISLSDRPLPEHKQKGREPFQAHALNLVH
jgi:hypothetical protein